MKECPGFFVISLFFLIFCCVMISEIGFSQVPLNLDEALRLAQQNNLALKQQEACESVARLEEWVQKAQRLPALDFSVASSYSSKVNEIDLSRTIGIPGRSVALGGHDRSHLILGWQQPVFPGFRLRPQVGLARNATQRAQSHFDAPANEVYDQV